MPDTLQLQFQYQAPRKIPSVFKLRNIKSAILTITAASHRSNSMRKLVSKTAILKPGLSVALGVYVEVDA